MRAQQRACRAYVLWAQGNECQETPRPRYPPTNARKRPDPDIRQRNGGHRGLSNERRTREERPSELFALDEALDLLEEKDEQLALLVKLRYFGGLTVEETAATLETSVRSVHRDWVTARAWLRMKIMEGAGLE